MTVIATRLHALRDRLTALGVQGFIQPRADEHQGEYVPARAERLAWLTGFTGSAGSAVVLADQAAVFVDGRYTLQAADEVAAEAFTICPLANMTPARWIERNAKVGGAIGFDPWLMTPTQLTRFEAATKAAGARLVPLDENPIDAVWADQPAPPQDPARPHDAAYTGETSEVRREKIAAALKDARADAVFLNAPDSIAWLLNIRGSDVPFTPFCLAFAILHQDATVDLFIDPAKADEAIRAHLGEGVRLHAPGQLMDALDHLGVDENRVLLAPDTAPVIVRDRLQAAGAEVVPGADPCQLPKACKTDTELAGMRAAHRRDGVALCRFLAWLDGEAPTGTVTETSAAERLEAFRRESDLCRGLSFPTISGAGPNGAIVHYRVDETTNRALEAGTLYLVDSGAQYPDGTTDVTRTVAIGDPDDEMRDRFTRVLKGHIALARAVFPKGTTGSQLDALARTPLWDAGLDYDHGTGHGVGSYLSVHEGPQRISKSGSTVALQAGMVVSNEPGYYKTGAYGIRIENLIAVAPMAAPERAERDLLGFETLTLAPIDRRLIDTDLLDGDERAWIDAYHARVRGEIGAGLQGGEITRAWLEAVTAPL